LRGAEGDAAIHLDCFSGFRRDRNDGAQALAAMNFSTTGAIFSRHLRPLKMP
jgi:hypothetical protein